MRLPWLTLGALLLAVSVVPAAEIVTLTAPITKPNQTLWKLDRVTMDITAKTFYIQFLGDNGEAVSKVYDSTTSPTGSALLTALNTANLTANSLVHRIYTRAITDGVISGTVSGTPD